MGPTPAGIPSDSRAGEGFRIIASKRGTKDDIYRAMFLEDDD